MRFQLPSAAFSGRGAPTPRLDDSAFYISTHLLPYKNPTNISNRDVSKFEGGKGDVRLRNSSENLIFLSLNLFFRFGIFELGGGFLGKP